MDISEFEKSTICYKKNSDIFKLILIQKFKMVNLWNWTFPGCQKKKL